MEIIIIKSLPSKTNYGKSTVSRVPCVNEWLNLCGNDYEVIKVVHELDYRDSDKYPIVATIFIRD